MANKLRKNGPAFSITLGYKTERKIAGKPKNNIVDNNKFAFNKKAKMLANIGQLKTMASAINFFLFFIKLLTKFHFLKEVF